MNNFLRNRWKLLSAVLVSCLFFPFLGVSVFIGCQVREKVHQAQSSESGDPVAALLAVAVSTERSISERDSAVWALGQLGSARALASLEELHSGANCGHSDELCQYGLEKAIRLCGGEFNVGALVWRHGELATR